MKFSSRKTGRRATRKFNRRSTRSKRTLKKTKIANLTHRFRRLGAKSIIYISGAGSVGSNGYPNNDTGLSVSSVAADTLTGCYQFGWSHEFKLANMVGSTEFTSLFDKYKITGIKYKIMYQCNDAAVQGSQVLPIIHYAVDSDDSSTPSTLGAVQERANCKSTVLGNTQVISFFFKPKVATMVYNGVASTGYAVSKSPYINSSYPSVPHYGVKIWMNNVYMVTSNNTAITVEPTYYLALRDPQ